MAIMQTASPGFSRGDAEGYDCHYSHLQMGDMRQLNIILYILLR